MNQFVKCSVIRSVRKYLATVVSWELATELRVLPIDHFFFDRIKPTILDATASLATNLWRRFSYTSKRMRSASNQWWWWCEVTEKCHFLRYESSTLILYKELSSTIFPLWVSQSGIGDTCPDLHFLQYIKAWMSSTDPVSSITNCYRLSVLYWPSTQLHHLVTHSWANCI